MKVDLVDIIETQGRWGDRSTISLTADIHKAKGQKQRYQEYAIILRRLRDPDNVPKSTRLEILSPIIRAALQEVLGEYSTVNMDSDIIIIDKPYAPLFHYRKELREYAASEFRKEDEKAHMNVLIQFMNKYLDETSRTYERLLPSELTTYNLLWTLFRPEEVVIARRDHFVEAYIVDSCSVTDIGKDGEVMMILDLVARHWDYNGARFGPVTTPIKIGPFLGTKKIRDLEVYPIAFHEENDGGDLRQKLIARGRKWRSILDVTHREYDGTLNGLTLLHRNKVHGFYQLTWNQTSGRIILDYATHQQAKPQFATHTSHLNLDTYVITEAQALLTPARVRGFSLVDKVWAFFLVDEVKDIKWAKNSFATLELDENLKQTISALVHVHGDASRAYEKFDDVIAGKGKGLIFLLTGPPGLGKTLTAESIAEEEHRPLYTITSGELGTDVVQTDIVLRRIFTRAKIWNSILLLDEADVFLAKRDSTDLERNAFVSIFLRLIEYYQGILFLTTNRVDEFDDAFQSRIHLTVNYQPLDEARRTIIWRNLLSRLSSEAWDEDMLKRLGRSYEINGREIGNLLRTAAALAAHQGVALAERHIQMVFGLNTMVQPNSS
ncbi:P-loop containing nucleoside triphosphate hydrolase protein [Cadophora sp. DSE1049]|nr:P-loop containing nucleoside triphosphate hydrolase protein [Cadophora sp. DSE1049]